MSSWLLISPLSHWQAASDEVIRIRKISKWDLDFRLFINHVVQKKHLQNGCTLYSPPHYLLPCHYACWWLKNAVSNWYRYLTTWWLHGLCKNFVSEMMGHFRNQTVANWEQKLTCPSQNTGWCQNTLSCRNPLHGGFSRNTLGIQSNLNLFDIIDAQSNKMRTHLSVCYLEVDFDGFQYAENRAVFSGVTGGV